MSHTGCGFDLGSHTMGTAGGFSRSDAARGVKLTTHLHLVLWLRVSGAIRLLPLYAFMTYNGKGQSLNFYGWKSVCIYTVNLLDRH